MSWRRFHHLVVNLPADSATLRAKIGDSAAWPVEAHLLAVLLDATNMANWQRSGKRSAPRPKPVPRPGQRRAGRHIKPAGGGLSIADFDAAYKAKLAQVTEWTEQEVIDDGP